MSVELKYLVLVAMLTGLLWVPYILNMIIVRGLIDAVGYPENPKPLAAWAQRMKDAHANAVENLVVFAPLVLAVHFAGVNNEATAMACMIYLWTRLAHFIVTAMKIAWLRTITFVIGVGCQLTLAFQLLS